MILALDIGTSSVKAGLYDPKEGMVGREEEAVPLRTAPGEGYEIDPRLWLAAVRRLVGALAADSYGRIRSVVISGNGPTVVAVDGDGRALRPAIPWMDRRGAREAAAILAGAEIEIDASFYLAKVHWLMRREPEIYRRTRWFLPCPEYVAFALTGEAAAVLPSPPFQRLMWSDEGIRALGLDAGRFPPFVSLGSEVGRIGRSAAEKWGLRSGTVVRIAGPDFLMSLLGTATLEPGDTCDRAGSSEGINRCTETAYAGTRLICLPHVVEGLYNVSGLISTSGKALDWFARTIGRGGEGYHGFYEGIRSTPAGAGRLLFLPSLAGERAPLWEPDARGAFVGLTLSHGKEEMSRAVAEAVGYAVRNILEVMEKAEMPVAALRVAGSLAGNRVLNQIKADITGCRIQVPRDTDSELIGDACVGLAARGLFRSPVEAARACVRIEGEISPQPENTALYEEMYGLYQELHRRLGPSFAGLERDPEPGGEEKP